MSQGLEWFNRLSIWWWEGILQSSWQAALVGAALLLTLQLFGRRWPAPLRYALLVLALLKFACPPLTPLPTGIFSHFASPKLISPQPLERKPPPPASEFRADLAQPGFEAGGPLFFNWQRALVATDV